MRGLIKLSSHILLIFLCGCVVTCKSRKPASSMKEAIATSPQTKLKMMTWNIKNFGGRESLRLSDIAGLISKGQYDIITIQELVKSTAAHIRMIALTKKLNELAKGVTEYCFGISRLADGTDSLERYGYLWRLDQVYFLSESTSKSLTPEKSCNPTGEVIDVAEEFSGDIVREPAVGMFVHHGSNKMKVFALVSIHLVPTSKNPWKEVSPLFRASDEAQKAKSPVVSQGLLRLKDPKYRVPILVAGDFNLGSSHKSFEEFAVPLGFRPLLVGTKTSLKSSARLLNKAYDNVWFKNISAVGGGVIDLYRYFPDVAIKDIYYGISDHSPVWAEFQF